MLTFFTTAKPFCGHDGVIQRNALKSWTLPHPKVEVILFGDEEGAAEMVKELGLRHELHVEPPFVVGRVFWDNWLVWKALASNHPVIDASHAILAVHQNHNYGYHPHGRRGF